MAPHDENGNWDDVVLRFVTEVFDVGDLQVLCTKFQPVVQWDVLIGSSAALPDRVLALQTMLRHEGRYHQLLCELGKFPQRQRSFRARRLHEALCTEGIQSLQHGLTAHLQPRSQRVDDPEEFWKIADEVFDTLKMIHPAYLQSQLGTDPEDENAVGFLENRVLELLRNGHWSTAHLLLKRFVRYLPGEDRVHDIHQQIDRALKQAQRAREDAEKGRWRDAKSELDAVNEFLAGKDYAAFPVLEDARRLLAKPQSLCMATDQAIREGRWSEAIANLQQLQSQYASYPVASPLVEQVTRLDQWLKAAVQLIEAGNWVSLMQATSSLNDVERTYPGIPAILERIERPRRWLADTGQLVEAGLWQAVSEAQSQLPEQDRSYPGIAELLERIDRPRRWLEQANELAASRDWEALEQAIGHLPDCDRAHPLAQEFVQRFDRWEQLYQQAKRQIAGQNWDDATNTLQTLQAEQTGYRDAAALLHAIDKGLEQVAVAARQREAHQWDAAEQALERAVAYLPDYEDAHRQLECLRSYKHLYEQADGHLAGHRYGSALADLRALIQQEPSYRNGKELLIKIERWVKLFTDALGHIAAKEWGAAEDNLAQLCKECHDYENAGSLLHNVRQVIVVASALKSPLVKDPWLAWERGSYPYAILQASDPRVTPGADMESIQNALFEVQRTKENVDLATARTAWDELRHTDRRLFVDAHLYNVRQAGLMLRFIEDVMAQDQQFPAPDRLTAEFAEDAPVVLALIDQRSAAIEKWQARQREQPRAGAVAHALGLCYLSAACHAEASRRSEAAVAAWRSALAQFALALNDRNYWREWGRERAETYSRPVLPNLTEELTRGLEAALNERLAQRADDPRRKREAQSAVYHHLKLQFAVEMEAVKTLKARGGLPLGTGRQAWFGPLYLAGEPTLVEPLARYCAELSQRPDDVVEMLLTDAPGEGMVRRLRTMFSSLGLAAALLESAPPQPEQALAQLAHANCDACPEFCADPCCTLHKAGQPAVRLCCPSCPNFSTRNPGYAQLPAPGVTLREDAYFLATQAHLKLAAAHMDQDIEGPAAPVISAWQTALDLASMWAGETKTRGDIREDVLAGTARLVTLGAQKDEPRWFDRAIELLEYVYQQSRQDVSLAAQIAEQLTNRGVYSANHGHLTNALQDLARAYRLTPRPTDRTRDQYATALILVAQDTARRDRDAARRMLDQAAQLLDEGRNLHPDYRRYANTFDQLQQARDEIEGRSPVGDPLDVLRRTLGPTRDAPPSLHTQAVSQRERGDLSGALDLLERAWQQSPEDRMVQDELITVLSQQFERLETANASAERDQLLAAWSQRMAGNPRLLQRLSFAGWLPRLQRDLQQVGFSFVPSARELLLPFNADTLGTVMVRLTVEDDLLALTAPLTTETGDEELALSNLLQVTGDLMGYKVISTETANLALAVRVPLAGLRPPRLECLARGLAHYADIQPSAVSRIEALRVHVNAARELNRITASSLGLATADWSSLHRVAQQRGWQLEIHGDEQAALTGPAGTTGKSPRPWLVQGGSSDGLRLAADLGFLRSGRDRLDPLRRLLQLNAALGMGKLSLTEEARLRLAVELPDPDETSLNSAIAVLEAQSERLRYDVAQG
jgi:outer membrane protein assembly factor BamD (BamD/ComL family)